MKSECMNWETHNMACMYVCGIATVHKTGRSWKHEGNKIKDNGGNLHLRSAIFLHYRNSGQLAQMQKGR